MIAHDDGILFTGDDEEDVERIVKELLGGMRSEI